MKYKGLLIPTVNLDSTISFYTLFFGFEVSSKGENFSHLKHRDSNDEVFISPRKVADAPAPVFHVFNLNESLRQLAVKQGAVIYRWEHSPYLGAYCIDADGIAFVLWEQDGL